jgi:hypothetical protein
MAGLTKTEIQTYRDKGYVVPDYRVPEATMAGLRAALDETLLANPEIRPEQLASIMTPKSGPGDTVGHRAFLDAALNRDLVELVSGVLGENVIMWGAQLFCKPGTDGMEVPMHQDGQYWPIRPLATCTLWLAIDASDRGNGCLEVLPGSHREKVHYSHRTEDRPDLVLNQAIDDSRLLETEPDCIELEPGQLSLHDVWLVHGSRPNRSGRRRAGFTVRYMPSTSVMRRDIEIPFAGYPVDWKGKPIWLARGHDVSGENDLIVGH